MAKIYDSDLQSLREYAEYEKTVFESETQRAFEKEIALTNEVTF